MYTMVSLSCIFILSRLFIVYYPNEVMHLIASRKKKKNAVLSTSPLSTERFTYLMYACIFTLCRILNTYGVVTKMSRLLCSTKVITL